MLFSDLKPKQKSFLTEISYQNVLAEYVLGMLEYPNMPVEIEYVRYLDFLLLKYGQAALYKSKHWGRWVIGDVVFVGIDLNEYGLLPDAICHDRAGHEDKFTDWQNSQECFVFFNNRNHTPDINIPRYADLLSKIDISLNANIVNSRMSPIVVAKDNNTKNQLAEIIKQNHDGHTEVITSPNILNEEGDNITVVNITDVNASDKIQYLLHAKDDLTREFLNLYGLHITGTGKMAQQSVEEITGSNNAALVIPYEMMKARNDTLQRFNAITGLNVVCQFSESWQREEAEAEKSGKLIEKTKEIVSSIEYSIRGVNGRIKMLTNAPRRIEFLRAYKAAHPRPDYQKPILDLITSEFRSRWLAPDEPPMWMIITDSNQNGDVWLLSEMPELLKEYRGEE